MTVRPDARLRIALVGLLCLTAAGRPFAEDGAIALGRLFSTPEERARIDEARRRARLPPALEAEAGTEAEVVEQAPPDDLGLPPPPPPRGTLTVDGYVLRGDGPATVWVNGESSPGGPLLGAEASVRPPRRPGEGVYIEAADGSRALLRPGQTLAEGASEVQEAWHAPVAPVAPVVEGGDAPVGRDAQGEPRAGRAASARPGASSARSLAP